jgi:Periplasmic copper-binding protein (NosD).
MRIYRTLSVIVLSLLFVLCLTGTATADSIITQNGDDYTVILDPNLHTVFNSSNHDLVGTGGVIYTETLTSNTSDSIINGDITVQLSFYHPSNYLSDINIIIASPPASVENVTINLVASSVGSPVNISVTSGGQYFDANVIIEGNNHAFEMNDTFMNQISIQNPNGYFIKINNLTLISTNNYEMPIQILGYSPISVSVNNLNAAGLVDFSGSSYFLYIEDSIFEDGGLRADGASGNSGSVYLMNSTITNGSIILGEFIDSSSIIGNRVSNNSNVLQFSNINAGIIHFIFDNYFEVAPSQYYVSINNCYEEILFYCSDGIFPGTNIVGGPYLAGNFWSYSDGSGYSDGLSNSLGYSNVPYTIPTSSVFVDSGITFYDPYPLTNYVASNSGSGGGTPLNIIDPTNQDPTNQDPTNQDPTNQDPTNQDPTNQDPTNQDPTDQDPTNHGPTNTNGQGSAGNSGRNGLSGNTQLIQTMKEAGQTLEDAIIPMGTSAAIVGASAGSVMLMLSNLIDLFFDVTSRQARHLKFTFRMPSLANIFTASSALSLLFFFLGVCIVDMLLGDAVAASMDHGFLMPIAVYIPALIIGTLINIGGGLFFDEIMDFIFEKTGKFVNTKTGILDIIAASGKMNAFLFILIFICAVAIVMLSIYLFDWSLI